MGRLREIAAASGDRLIEAARKVGPEDSIESSGEDGRFKLHLSVVIIQALHHGNDHRTHVCTILGAHDIGYGEMDVWAYGDVSGLIVPMPGRDRLRGVLTAVILVKASREGLGFLGPKVG